MGGAGNKDGQQEPPKPCTRGAGVLKCPHCPRIWCLPWTELTTDPLPKALLIPTLYLYEAQNAKATESKVARRAIYESEKRSLSRNTVDSDPAIATAHVNLRAKH